MILQDIESKKGQLVTGYYKFASMSDGTEIRFPVMIAEGMQEGKTLVINAAIHGEEFGGSVSLIRFMKELDLTTLKGTIIAVPVVNILGFWTLTRTTEMDGFNLNRVFPGTVHNSFTHQMANAYFQEIACKGDYVIDLHSGGLAADVPLYSIYHPATNTPAEQVAREMCRHCGSPIIWKIRTVNGLGNSLGANVTLQGIPCVTIECDGGEVHEETINRYLSAVTNIAKYLGFIPGEAPTQEKYLVLNEGSFVYNRCGGFFQTEHKAGDCLHKGDVVGRIMNTLGEIVEEVVCEEDYACLTALCRENQPLHSGQLIAEVIPVESEEA